MYNSTQDVVAAVLLMLIAKTVYNYNYYNRTAARREAFKIKKKLTRRVKKKTSLLPRTMHYGPNFHDAAAVVVIFIIIACK